MLPSLSQLKGQFSFQLTIGMIPKRCHVSNTSFPAVIILWWPQTGTPVTIRFFIRSRIRPASLSPFFLFFLGHFFF